MALGANAFEGSSLAGVPEIKSASRQSTKKQMLRMINPAGSCHLEMASVPLLAATLQRRKVRPTLHKNAINTPESTRRTRRCPMQYFRLACCEAKPRSKARWIELLLFRNRRACLSMERLVVRVCDH